MCLVGLGKSFSSEIYLKKIWTRFHVSFIRRIKDGCSGVDCKIIRFLFIIYLSNVMRMILKGVISSGESHSPQHCDK